MLYTVCPTCYRTRHFFNNSNTNEDIATKFEQEYVPCVRNEEECVCSGSGSERENLPKQTTNHRRLKSKHRQRDSGSDSRRSGKDFPKYGVPGSILSGRKRWPLQACVMMSSYFFHNEVSPLQISLRYPH